MSTTETRGTAAEMTAPAERLGEYTRVQMRDRAELVQLRPQITNDLAENDRRVVRAQLLSIQARAEDRIAGLRELREESSTIINTTSKQFKSLRGQTVRLRDDAGELIEQIDALLPPPQIVGTDATTEVLQGQVVPEPEETVVATDAPVDQEAGPPADRPVSFTPTGRVQRTTWRERISQSPNGSRDRGVVFAAVVVILAVLVWVFWDDIDSWIDSHSASETSINAKSPEPTPAPKTITTAVDWPSQIFVGGISRVALRESGVKSITLQVGHGSIYVLPAGQTHCRQQGDSPSATTKTRDNRHLYYFCYRAPRRAVQETMTAVYTYADGTPHDDVDSFRVKPDRFGPPVP